MIEQLDEEGEMKHKAWNRLFIAATLVVIVISSSLGAQEGSIQEANQLNAQAAELAGQGRYREAIPLAEHVVEILEKALGPEHMDTAAALSDLAWLYKASGEYAKAEPLFKRALAIYEEVPGPEDPYTATALNNLAALYQVTGDYAKAEPLYQRALAIDEKVLGPEHPDTAASLTRLAGLYKVFGEYAKAEPLYQRALAIFEKVRGPEDRDTTTVLNNFGSLYEASGEYSKAEPLYQQALANCEKVLGPEHPDTAVVLNNLGGLYQAAGAYTKAEPLYLRALEIREKALGPEHPLTASSVTRLAGLYKVTGAYTKAEALYQRALAIFEKASGPEHTDTATCLNNLAGLYADTGEFAKAEPLYRRALAIYEKMLGPQHPDTATALDNLAEVYRNSDAFAKAEALYKRALAICEKVLGPQHRLTAIALNNLALLYDTIGSHAKAVPLYQRALAITEKVFGPEYPGNAGIRSNLAALYEASGKYAMAESLLRRAQVIEEANTARFLISGSEARMLAYLEQRLGGVFADISFSLAHPTARGTALGLTSVLQYKGRVLEAMSDSAARLRRSVAPQDRALFDQLSGVAQEYSTLTFRGPGDLSPEAYRQRLDALGQQQEKLEADLSSSSAALRQAVTPITLEAVRQALPADAVLVEWFRYEPFDPNAKWSTRWGTPSYVAYVLKRSGEPVAINLGEAEPIEDLVAEFRTAVSDPTSTYFKDVGEDLYGKLIRPLHPYMAHTERLLLSPDGALNLLPFAALVDEYGQYLAQRFEITYLTSGRDLLRIAAESPARSSAVIVADPNYGQSANGETPVDSGLQPARSIDLDRGGLVFTPLPGTAAEAKALQSLLKLDAQNVLTGDRATESSLRELHGPRILHLATHAFFLNDQEVAAAALKPVGFSSETLSLPSGENPLLRSGLALAGANARHSGATDDGILTAAEMAQLDLLGTQLAVLSACETGVGTVQTGEGVYGLRRALVLAGAQAQLDSLWKVADAATQELMLDYYQRLLKGKGRSEALRAAQKAMITNPVRQHPYYWAAFIPIGDWRPLTTER